MAALFVEDAHVNIIYNRSGAEEHIADLTGADAIGQAVAGMMAPHPPRGWSHHTTSDYIIVVDGDGATLDAQFIVFNVVGAEQPAGGWPRDALSMQGAVSPAESGYYRSKLVRRQDGWKFETHTVVQDLPFAMPAVG